MMTLAITFWLGGMFGLVLGSVMAAAGVAEARQGAPMAADPAERD